MKPQKWLNCRRLRVPHTPRRPFPPVCPEPAPLPAGPSPGPRPRDCPHHLPTEAPARPPRPLVRAPGRVRVPQPVFVFRLVLLGPAPPRRAPLPRQRAEGGGVTTGPQGPGWSPSPAPWAALCPQAPHPTFLAQNDRTAERGGPGTFRSEGSARRLGTAPPPEGRPPSAELLWSPGLGRSSALWGGPVR